MTEELPNEVHQGNPLSYLERLDPPQRRLTLMTCLAVLGECREYHAKDPDVLMGLVTMERHLKNCIQKPGDLTPQRTILATERPL